MSKSHVEYNLKITNKFELSEINCFRKKRVANFANRTYDSFTEQHF